MKIDITDLESTEIPETKNLVGQNSSTLDSTQNTQAIKTKDHTKVTETTKTPISTFNAVYNELHSKFPEIINIDKPVLLAIGIRKEISKETGISSVIIKRWIAKYCRKSKYYALHKEGAVRYNCAP
jgi:hypothetical protein